jgi:hypothetical protein
LLIEKNNLREVPNLPQVCPGVVTWNQISDYGQYVKSGMYFYHVSNKAGEEKKGKFAIVN